ncbi:hypothetical protein PIB30_040166 [Stylosanthes scabra]|uniref:Uncharacterized protein n=1 Tax=Stylosanthes scabra TaxID=79078 RepID=A0ABU6XG99_9FABA|nr:hypothetical protein [Stylosanthes scabra]
MNVHHVLEVFMKKNQKEGGSTAQRRAPLFSPKPLWKNPSLHRTSPEPADSHRRRSPLSVDNQQNSYLPFSSSAHNLSPSRRPQKAATPVLSLPSLRRLSQASNPPSGLVTQSPPSRRRRPFLSLIGAS